jgi:hypothetical protein
LLWGGEQNSSPSPSRSSSLSRSRSGPPGETLGKHLSALHTLLLAGRGSGPTFFEFADRLLDRFGDASRSELSFFKQTLPTPKPPPATAATAAAAAAVAVSQAKQLRHAAAMATSAAAVSGSGAGSGDSSNNGGDGSNSGSGSGSSAVGSAVRSDDLVGRVLTSLLLDAAHAFGLGRNPPNARPILRGRANPWPGGEAGLAAAAAAEVDAREAPAWSDLKGLDGGGGQLDGTLLTRCAFAPADAGDAADSGAGAPAGGLGATTLLGAVLGAALPGLLGQARCLRCRCARLQPASHLLA